MGERLFREVCKNVNVSDLPTGARKQWVNQLAAKLYAVMKSDLPVKEAHKFVGHILERQAREVFEYFERIEQIEQQWRKDHQ